MPNYNLQDPYDIDRLRGEFNAFSEKELEEYIEFAKSHKIGFDKVGVLIQARKNGKSLRKFSDAQRAFVLNIIDFE